MSENANKGVNLKTVLVVVFTCASLLSSCLVFAEPPENLDFIGGYYEDGQYHCYSEPCFTIHKGTEAAIAKIRPFNPREWANKRGNTCQKTYTQVLAETSQIEISYAKKNECVFVTNGQWLDPYTNKVVDGVRSIALDQRISLQEAHYYGGSGWPRSKRMAFKNDPMNLLPVSIEQKRDRNGRPGTQWMPQNKAYWCDYVVHREIVARQYDLRPPKHERDFNKEMKVLYCKY